MILLSLKFRVNGNSKNETGDEIEISWIESMRETSTEGLVNFWVNTTRLMGINKVSIVFYNSRLTQHEEILSQLENEAEVVEYSDDIERFESIIKRDMYRSLIEDGKKYSEMMCSYGYIFLVSLLEFYISDIVKYIFSENTNILKSEKKLNYEEILSYNTIEGLYEYMIERECESLGYKSYEEIKKYFNGKFKIDFTNLKGENEVNSIFEIRNILVHNRGIVNEKFLSKIKDSKYKLGDKITLNQNDVDSAISMLRALTYYIDTRAMELVGEDVSSKDPDTKCPG